MIPKRSAAGALAACVLALTACATSGGEAANPSSVNPATWSSVMSAAHGQTVDWYMYGGDDTLNTFVSGYVTDRLREQGVTLKPVRVTDTADAVNKVLGEKRAGKRTGGSVDAIWANGENFATGKQAGLWYCGWPKDLPNAKYVDSSDPAVNRDFGVPVQGCESVWQQANSALVYDSRALKPADVQSVTSLLAWASAHPGKFTYPAPPDFTGSMAVRTILYDTIGGADQLPETFNDKAFQAAFAKTRARLTGIEPSLWRRGSTYPQSQTAVEKLYGNGEISAFFTYGPGAVADQVRKGIFPASTREAVLQGGNIANDSYLAIPENAQDRAGALVLADVLQDPKTQLALYKAEGIYPAIDLSRTDPATRAAFAAVSGGPSVLPLAALTANVQPELSAKYVAAIEDDWKRTVLQR